METPKLSRFTQLMNWGYFQSSNRHPVVIQSSSSRHPVVIQVMVTTGDPRWTRPHDLIQYQLQVWINKDTKVICQGMTGRQGTFPHHPGATLEGFWVDCILQLQEHGFMRIQKHKLEACKANHNPDLVNVVNYRL